MTASNHRKNIVKLLQANAYRHQLWTVFSDFVELAALAIANACDLSQREPREARYLQIIKAYSPDEVARFPQMLAELVNALEAEPGDMLGMLFGELELGNAARGQFFTPYAVCRLMAELSIGDGSEMRGLVERRGYATASEPACGAGAMVIALAEAVNNAGLCYQNHLHVTAVDVDSRAVHMAYVQFSLLHIPAVVVLGNTLTLEESQHWYTPAHVMGGWRWKLRRGYALGAAEDIDIMPSPVQLVQLPVYSQADLFEAA